jgi:hypothetical protein
VANPVPALEDTSKPTGGVTTIFSKIDCPEILKALEL